MKVNVPNLRLWHEERILAQKKYASSTLTPRQKVSQAITGNITTELNTTEVNNTELIQQIYDNLLAELNIIEHTIIKDLANLNSTSLVSYHSSERGNPIPLPTQDDITSPLINSSLLQTDTNPLSNSTEIITDDDVDYDHEPVRVLESDIHKWRILDMVDMLNEHIRWRELSFNKISPYLHNIDSTPEKYQYKYDPSINCLKESVTNATIKYFSTEKKSDTTMECFNYVGCGYLDSSKLTDDNIKAFSMALLTK